MLCSIKEFNMFEIKRATEQDYKTIADIGRVSVALAHRDSCSVKDMNEFLENTYNYESIIQELENPAYTYHLIYYNTIPAGFSKIILNYPHPNIYQKNVTKLDRIYLLESFYDKKMGLELLNFNINYSKANGQIGVWLFTWVGNSRAINFYKKAGFNIVGTHKFKVTETHYNEHHQMFLNFSS